MLVALLAIGAGCLNQTTTQEEMNPRPAVEEAESTTVSVQLTTSGATTDYNQTIEVNSGATVEEVMAVAAANTDFEYTTQTAAGIGAYVDSVSGVTGSADAGYWLFYINDEPALEGISTQTVNDRDVIEWRLEPAQ